jgi:hypothetical protein
LQTRLGQKSEDAPPGDERAWWLPATTTTTRLSAH